MTVNDTIAALGGHKAITARIGITRQAVLQWRARGRFPGHMYLPLCAWAEELGLEIDPALFQFERKPRRRKSDAA